MKIEQFEDKGLAQYSYVILSECAREIVIIDPARDPKPYYKYAKENDAKIVGVILTHSHADFVSAHAQIQRETGATIYVSSRLEAKFPHKKIDEGVITEIGKIKLKAIYTPGHSFDSICVLLKHEGKEKALFTGDTLFIGDVGRPDLRGSGESANQMRRDLASAMYGTLNNVIKNLPEQIIVYPGHGAGTLCGKSLSKDPNSTIGRELKENYAFQESSEEKFVDVLLDNQPFIPPYFSYDVALNQAGAADFEESVSAVKSLSSPHQLDGQLIIDTRPEKEFKKSHIKGAINIQNGEKFETWLGTVVYPDQKFIVIANDNEQLNDVIGKAAKIGYETNIKGVFIPDAKPMRKSSAIDLEEFKNNPDKFTIIDIRNREEALNNQIFENSINIPLPELQAKVKDVPLNKPIVVHCAGGYRSAIGASILEKELPNAIVFDLSEAIKNF